MYTKFTIAQFLLSGAHVGHSIKLRDKKYNLYLSFVHENIDIINTLYNLPLLRRVLFIINNLSFRRKKFFFISENATLLSFFVSKSSGNCPIRQPFYSLRWRPGVLSNFQMTVKLLSRFGKLDNATGVKLEKNSNEYFSNLHFRKILNYYSGMLSLRRLPDFVFFCTAVSSQIAVSEARVLRIPSSGIIDTNGSPYLLTFPIFGNDDSFYSLTFVLDLIFKSLQIGNDERSLFFLKRVLFLFAKNLNSEDFVVDFTNDFVNVTRSLNSIITKNLIFKTRVKIFKIMRGCISSKFTKLLNKNEFNKLFECSFDYNMIRFVDSLVRSLLNVVVLGNRNFRIFFANFRKKVFSCFIPLIKLLNSHIGMRKFVGLNHKNVFRGVSQGLKVVLNQVILGKLLKYKQFNYLVDPTLSTIFFKIFAQIFSTQQNFSVKKIFLLFRFLIKFYQIRKALFKDLIVKCEEETFLFYFFFLFRVDLLLRSNLLRIEK